jgi:hypothetical protein
MSREGKSPWVILNAHYLIKLGTFVRASTVGEETLRIPVIKRPFVTQNLSQVGRKIGFLDCPLENILAWLARIKEGWKHLKLQSRRWMRDYAS